jgi:hypothetical protein
MSTLYRHSEYIVNVYRLRRLTGTGARGRVSRQTAELTSVLEGLQAFTDCGLVLLSVVV